MKSVIKALSCAALILTTSILCPAIVWTPHQIASLNTPVTIIATDVDLDMDVDFISGTSATNRLVWFSNSGSEVFTQNIPSTTTSIYDVFPADIDGDNDIDIVTADNTNNSLDWFNNNGSQTFTKITIQAAYDIQSVYACDVDGDGDMDLVTSAMAEREIAWWENNGSETFTKHALITNFTNADYACACDIDNDGDIDILGGTSSANLMFLWTNDGSQVFTRTTVGNYNATTIYSIDMEGDGDIDLVTSNNPGGTIDWWENNGSQTFTRHQVETSWSGANSAYACDVDNDGDIDILGAAIASANELAWWINNGSESFTKETIALVNARTVYATDVDQDGDIDVAATSPSSNTINWYESDLNPLSGGVSSAGYTTERWYMIGIPVTVTSGDPTTLFGDDHTNSIGYPNWRISQYETSTGGYLRWGEENYGTPTIGNPPAMTPGLGYWYRQGETPAGITLDISNAQLTGVVDQSSRFEVQAAAPSTSPVYRGLKQMANPFNYAYDWRNTWIYNETDDQYKTIYEAAASNWVSGYAYTWDPAAANYVQVNFSGSTGYTLNAWQGFFFEQLVASKTLYVQFAPQSMMDNVESDPFASNRTIDSENEWELNLQVESVSGLYRDLTNKAGARAISSDGYDLFDATEIQPQDYFVQVYFPHVEWGMSAQLFSYDFRDLDFTQPEEWNFSVRSYGLPNQQFELTWPNMSGVPSEYSFVLEQTDDNILIGDMREVDSYLVTMGSEPGWNVVHFRMTVTDGSVSVGSGNSNEIPTSYKLFSTYPNPFNPSTSFKVAMPEAGNLMLSVYNIAGQEVSVLSEGYIGAGVHSFTFNADGLSSGLYLIRAEVPGKMLQIQKSVYIR